MFAKTVSVTAVSMVLSLALAGLDAGSAFAEKKKPAGPTQAQIDCQNRAVNDYWDQIKACDQALSDLPADNQQCHNDALDDLRRRKAACTAAIVAGGTMGTLGTSGVLDTGATGTTGGMTLVRPGKITIIGVSPQ